MKFSIFAPGTIGNVASGFDILGLAVDGLGDTFHFESSDTYSIKVSGRDAADIPLDSQQNVVTIAAESFYKLFGQRAQPFSVHIDRALPMSGGLGASAASCVAGALAAARFAKAGPCSDLILQAALDGETAVAGAHLDNIAPCFYGGLTLVQDTDALAVYKIPMLAELWIVLVTPPIRIKTKDSREVLRPQLSTAEWTKQMAHCTTLALALSRGDKEHIAYGLTDIYAEPSRRALIPGFLNAQEAAKHAGAYGFSLSGSGPTCFALCPSKTVADGVGCALQAAFGPKAQMNIVRPRLKGAEVLS
ncbi:MAG: homoserine kinase [Chitinophagaceae bacterium]|nr:homoserine kinase [Oligoflexus sp.]